MFTVCTKAQMEESGVVLIKCRDAADDVWHYPVVVSIHKTEPLILKMEWPRDVFDVRDFFGDQVTFWCMEYADYLTLYNQYTATHTVVNSS